MLAAMLGVATALAMGGGACGEPPTGADDTQVVQSAVTTITISGKMTKTGNVGVPNIPIRLNGKSQAWALTNSSGNYSFPGLATGSYSVRPEAAGCTFSPDVVNLNNLTTNKTQNFTVSGAMCTGPASAAKAMIMVDSRLYAQLTTQIEQYKELAEARRGFTIDLRRTEQFDNWTYVMVKNYIVNARAANPGIEGVLFIGNIKLPSLYKARIDTGLTRLYPRYYEDLDGVHTRRYATGEIDPICTPENDIGPNPKCIISPRFDGGSGPVTVLAHDFDDTDFGPNPGPEIWTSYMPVGVLGSANTYVDFGNQLRPYFQKLARFYNHEFVSNRRYYYVGNDRGEQFGQVWNAFGKNNIDFYGRPGPNGEVNTEFVAGCQPSPGVNLCYRRWNVESFATADAFITHFNSNPWTGEGWQEPSIFISHMNAALYDVSDVIVHSTPDGSLISATDAKTLTNGGLIAASSGCSVGAFAQPGAPATTAVDIITMASGNIMLSYLYGNSKSVASTGDPHWRGHYAHYPTMYEALKLGGNTAYLGSANKARMTRLYAEAGDALGLKENSSEMLFGDPFMDLRP